MKSDPAATDIAKQIAQAKEVWRQSVAHLVEDNSFPSNPARI